MFSARPFLATGLIALVAVAGTDAGAQQIYRIVGPDGRVTFSDQPPAQGSGRVDAAPVVALPSGANGAGLPFALRQVATRFPVTLYTSSNCDPCLQGRAMLSSRGVPYTERTISSPQDVDALKRLAGSVNVPVLTIGGQLLNGYSDIEWSQYLDAAGYPKTSQLPAGYAQAPATPLVAIQAPALPAPAVSTPGTGTDPAVARPTTPAPENPAGIRF